MSQAAQAQRIAKEVDYKQRNLWLGPESDLNTCPPNCCRGN